ncbi:MAG TPA: hypothetical protein VN843_06590 [Anaerolineales bacterium]|nr:hypothetical protein [Anaerolineales bacterium]
MTKKRAVFLFGAGATFEWNSPTTRELTDLIRETGFRTSNNTTTITDFIYSTLLESGYPSHAINFETIISVIEELVVYYSKFDTNLTVPSISNVFLTARHEKQLLNYSIEGIARHGYRLQIPAGGDYPLSKHAYNKETPSQFFFEQLLAALLTGVTARIHEYAYHTETSPMKSVDDDMSKLFVKWMKLLSEDRVLRLYTLNYERIFKILLARAGISIFEGFDCEEFVVGTLRANVPRILSDSENHVHYNLHGSAFWEVLDIDRKQLPNPEIVLPSVFALPLTNQPVSVQIEKGKTLLVTNMITGYQKAQRGMITPFKQMQAALDRDCCFADELYIVGYSFGDEHINGSVKTALRYNKRLKVTIVDPYFIANRLDYEFALHFFPFKDHDMRPKKIGNDVYSYFGDDFTVHTIGFREFLERPPEQGR